MTRYRCYSVGFGRHSASQIAGSSNLLNLGEADVAIVGHEDGVLDRGDLGQPVIESRNSMAVPQSAMSCAQTLPAWLTTRIRLPLVTIALGISPPGHTW